MRVFLSAGEASGDAYAAAIARLIRGDDEGEVQPVEGIGGPKLASAANGSVLDSSHWGAISIIQSLFVAPKVILGYNRARKALRSGPPGLLIPIDFGYFNVRLARYAKTLGWKVLYFIPPGSWRHDRQAKDLAEIADLVITPFPWSADLLKQNAVDARFVGHPLKSLIKEWREGSVPDQPEGRRIAVLPGSRAHEIERNLPLIANVLKPLAKWEVEFAVAPSADLGRMRRTWAKLVPGSQASFTERDVYGVLSRAKAAIVCSGTATLEAALIGTPMVVVYRITRAMAAEAILIRYKIPEFISLPNIILQESIVPEYKHLIIDPVAVRKRLAELLEPGPARQAQLTAFKEIEGLLGPDDAIAETARIALRIVQEA